jgi:ribosome-associated protein
MDQRMTEDEQRKQADPGAEAAESTENMDSPVKKGEDRAQERSREQAERLAQVAGDALLDKKGRDVVILDVGDLTTLAEFFVVCHGTSETQIKALADNVEEKTREILGEKAWKREGFDSRRWIILDYVNVVVHVFSEEKREFYGIERMWNDAKRVEVAL